MHIPLWLDMRGRRVLVVGGGRVGTRRALMFREAGAAVRVLAKAFSGELRSRAGWDPGLELVEADASREEAVEPHVAWADIVVIAVDDAEAAEAVWRVAERLRRWVNDATDAARTQVVVPYRGSVFGGAIEVAATSLGRSGVAARHALRRCIEALEADQGLRVLYEAMARLKPVLKELVPSAKERVPIYFEAEGRLLPLIEQGGGVEEALRALASLVSERTGVDEARALEMLRRASPQEPGGA